MLSGQIEEGPRATENKAREMERDGTKVSSGVRERVLNLEERSAARTCARMHVHGCERYWDWGVGGREKGVAIVLILYVGGWVVVGG